MWTQAYAQVPWHCWLSAAGDVPGRVQRAVYGACKSPYQPELLGVEAGNLLGTFVRPTKRRRVSSTVLSRNRSRCGRQRSSAVDEDDSGGGGCAAQPNMNASTLHRPGNRRRLPSRSWSHQCGSAPAAPAARRAAPHQQLQDSVESSLASVASVLRRAAPSRRCQDRLR